MCGVYVVCVSVCVCVCGFLAFIRDNEQCCITSLYITSFYVIVKFLRSFNSSLVFGSFELEWPVIGLTCPPPFPELTIAYAK